MKKSLEISLTFITNKGGCARAPWLTHRIRSPSVQSPFTTSGHLPLSSAAAPGYEQGVWLADHLTPFHNYVLAGFKRNLPDNANTKEREKPSNYTVYSLPWQKCNWSWHVSPRSCDRKYNMHMTNLFLSYYCYGAGYRACVHSDRLRHAILEKSKERTQWL